MAGITYTRAFTHEDWIDNENVVQAGGERGFNKKFHEIEDEFDELSVVVQQVNTALGTLGEEIAEPVTIGFLPVLLPYRAAVPTWSEIFWSRELFGTPQGTFVEKLGDKDQARGVFPVSLPDGVKLKNIKVLGEQTGGNMLTEFIQESRSAPFSKTTLITVNGLATDATAPTPIPGERIFDSMTNLYYLDTRVTDAGGDVQVKLRGFQITYQR